MITQLMTLAKDIDPVRKTLEMIKISADYNQNLKNLKKANKDQLKNTFAYLTNSTLESSNVTKYKLDGLRHAIMTILHTLIPQECNLCLDDKIYLNSLQNVS